MFIPFWKRIVKVYCVKFLFMSKKLIFDVLGSYFFILAFLSKKYKISKIRHNFSLNWKSSRVLEQNWDPFRVAQLQGQDKSQLRTISMTSWKECRLHHTLKLPLDAFGLIVAFVEKLDTLQGQAGIQNLQFTQWKRTWLINFIFDHCYCTIDNICSW